MQASIRLLTDEQAEGIHHHALRVLDEVGVRVEHPLLRRRLTSVAGGRTDAAGETVRFKPRDVERVIADSPKVPPAQGPPGVSAHASVYQSMYLEPGTQALVAFDENRLARYAALSRSLGGGSPGLLGVPFQPEGLPRSCDPLSEKLFAWRCGLVPDGTVQDTRLCQPLLDMFSCHASAADTSLEAEFRAAGYLISPLRLARPECEQLLFFEERGLRMGIGHLPVQGATAPVSLEGTLVLALAEQIFLFLLRKVFEESPAFALGSGAATMDMRRAVSCYGRPEMQRVNMAFADLARFYGCLVGCQTGLTDAKTPSCEAGAQKAYSALAAALASGHGGVAAGSLSADEVCSPVQMVIDFDIAAALQRLVAGDEMGDLDDAFEEIAAAGHAGGYLATSYTAERHRRELWTPRTWSFEFLNAWQASGASTDVDRARDYVADFEEHFEYCPAISSDEDRELRTIISRATA